MVLYCGFSIYHSSFYTIHHARREIGSRLWRACQIFNAMHIEWRKWNLKGQQPRGTFILIQIFLSKVYKNNTAPKPKRMNSIRLSRFNAFLYRMNSPYPTDVLTNNIIQLSLIAMLNNSRNFEEEEGNLKSNID